MSTEAETFTFVRPTTIDEATLSRILFIRPVEKVVQPIIDHNLELIEDVRRLRPWYRGECDTLGRETLSALLDPDANSACEMLRSFIEVVKHFRPGEFPAHCCKMRELEFTTRFLIRELSLCFESPAFKNATSHLGYLVFTWSAPDVGLYAPHEWHRRLDLRLDRLVNAFGDISKACLRRERERDAEIAFREVPPATKEDVDAAAADVKRTVRKAKRAIIADAHTARTSEADRRVPKGARGRQIGSVRKLVREARADGKRMSILRACHKVWQDVKGGYPSAEALYHYCHNHAQEF